MKPSATTHPNYRVIITRPEPQASLWQQHLAAMGLASVVAPVMAITPVSDKNACERVKQLVLNIDHYQKAIFVSRNAVNHAFEWLETYWPQLPMGIQYFAVGSGTAEQLSRADVNVTALTGQDSAMNSEALLADPSLQQVAGDKIVIFRGVGGRNVLAQTLRQRGARVDFCELYQRQRPAGAATWLAHALAPAQRRRDLLVVHSGESLHNLVTLLSARPELADYARTCPLVVPGERVTKLAREQGFRQVLTAYNASDRAMLDTLQNHIGTHAAGVH
jgi:uroporphyrinogen-III synthase